MSKVSREIYDIEWLYLYFNELYSQFNIQIVIEGIGRLEPKALQLAIDQASHSNAMVRTVKKGKMWVEKDSAPILNILNGEYVINGSEFNHTFLNQKLDLSTSTAEVYYFPEAGQLLFRVFHGIMDGKGVLNFIHNVFRHLRNESLIPSISQIREIDVLNQIKIKTNTKIPLSLKHQALGKNQYKLGKTPGIKRIDIQGNPKQLIPQICKHLTDIMDIGTCQWMVPVDVRRHLPKFHCDNNLTFPIFISTHKGQSLAEINGSYLYALKENEEVSLKKAKIFGISWLPAKVITYFFSLMQNLQKYTYKYAASAIVSYLAKYKESSFSTPTFEAKKVIAIPAAQPFVPLLLSVTNSDQQVHILVSYYKEIMDELRLENSLNLLKLRLEKDIHESD